MLDHPYAPRHPPSAPPTGELQGVNSQTAGIRLYLWPVVNDSQESIVDFLRMKTRMDEAFLNDELRDVVKLNKDIKALMVLSFDLKKDSELRRNVKFDEDNLGLYMDLSLGAGLACYAGIGALQDLMESVMEGWREL